MERDSYRRAQSTEALLWSVGTLRCTSVVAGYSHIEIRITVGNTLVDCAVFDDTEAAAQYAVAQMNVYGAT
jgi:hypothetical protein